MSKSITDKRIIEIEDEYGNTSVSIFHELLQALKTDRKTIKKLAEMHRTGDKLGLKDTLNAIIKEQKEAAWENKKELYEESGTLGWPEDFKDD